MTIIPWHHHIPDPHFISMVRNKRILLDVCTLLRALLFPSSHAARLLEHIERSPGSKGVICGHVRSTAIRILEERNPASLEKFISALLELFKRNVLEVVSDGNPALLRREILYDPLDDDIVMATAIQSGCDLLATLDRKLAKNASQIIEILPPAQPECNVFLPTISTDAINNVEMYAGPHEGSVMMEVVAANGSTGHYNKKGRRYVFCTDTGFACWLNQKSWKYQLGYPDCLDPVFTFPALDLERPVLLSISYDSVGDRISVGWYQSGQEAPVAKELKKVNLPTSIGTLWSILSRGETDSFNGYWGGILTTASYVETRAMEYALQNKSNFEPLDSQRYKIENAVFDTALQLTTDIDIMDLITDMNI